MEIQIQKIKTKLSELNEAREETQADLDSRLEGCDVAISCGVDDCNEALAIIDAEIQTLNWVLEIFDFNT